MDEHKAIRRVQISGDRAAADHLVRLYYDDVFSFIHRQVRADDCALDLTQDTLISMLRTLTHYNPKKSGFRTWIFRIAMNKVIDWYRSRATRPTAHLSLDEADLVDPTDQTIRIENAQLSERVNTRLSHFSSQAQQIFRLHVFGEYTFAEIARELKISDNTAKTTYYRLTRRLRKELADDFDR